MIYENEKTINLTPIADHTTEEFILDGVAGRDALADQIEKDIEEYSQQAFSEGPRRHLGASVIGHECERYIWFSFRWMKFEKFSGRMQRLFNRGHLEEDRIIQWLRGIGFEIQQVDVDGKQIRIADVGNHFGGSTDGNAIFPTRYKLPAGIQILVEFKTSNSKGFGPISSMGVIKAKPRHYSQMCVYGYKRKLQYALYICVNKDDDDIAVEVVELDWDLGKQEIEKAEKIILAIYPPPRISEDPSYFKCKWCPMNGICHLNDRPEMNCRSCANSTPVEDGNWRCNHWNAIIPVEAIAKGCDAWKGLI